MNSSAFTYPALQVSHDPTPALMEAMVSRYGATCITDVRQVQPGQILHGPRGYWYVNNVSIKRNRVILERCIPDFSRKGAPLARAGKFEAHTLKRINSNMDWHIFDTPAQKTGWKQKVVDSISNTRFGLFVMAASAGMTVGGLCWLLG